MSDLDDGLFQGAKGALGGGVKISPSAVRLTPCALRSQTRHSSTDSSSLI
jgi:hypothetical protein